MEQEQCVLDYLRTSGAGVLVDSLEALPPDLFTLCNTARRAATEIDNRAVFEVADFLSDVVPQPREDLV